MARRESRRASDDAEPAQTVQQYSGGVTESWTVRMNGTIHGEWGLWAGCVCRGQRKVYRAQDRGMRQGKGKMICNSPALENCIWRQE